MVYFEKCRIFIILFFVHFQSKSADIFINAYLLSDLLYESEFEGQMWMLYDSNKMLVGVGDAFSERVNIVSTVVVHIHPRLLPLWT